MKEILYEQLAKDYCCPVSEVTDACNHFHIYEPLEGRRRFSEGQECFLKIVSLRNKLLFAGAPEIIEWCRARYTDFAGQWFMEPRTILELNEKLKESGHKVSHLHPFYIATEKSAVAPAPYDVVIYRDQEIEQFRGDARMNEAFSFQEAAPDRIGVGAWKDGNLLGMAGASADSPTMWQIGINVEKEAEGLGIGPDLVARLKNEILDLGILPYYGTAVSHINSQRVAQKAGFVPAWTELATS